MKEYEFELVFKLKDSEDPSHYLDALFESGCDDAGPGIGKAGHLGMSFTREAESAFEAIRTAINDVRKAIPHAELESAGPWLLNSSEMAFEFGWTKQNMSKYLSGKSTLGEAPAPLIPGRTSYWNMYEVARWLYSGEAIDIDTDKLSLYREVWALNLAIERSKVESNQYDEFLEIA